MANSIYFKGRSKGRFRPLRTSSKGDLVFPDGKSYDLLKPAGILLLPFLLISYSGLLHSMMSTTGWIQEHDASIASLSLSNSQKVLIWNAQIKNVLDEMKNALEEKGDARLLEILDILFDALDKKSDALDEIRNAEEEYLQCLYRRILSWQRLLCLTVFFSFFSEYPDGVRHSCTTMPWTIWPSLVVLWGVCWMFYPPWPSDPTKPEDTSQELNYGYLGISNNGDLGRELGGISGAACYISSNDDASISNVNHIFDDPDLSLNSFHDTGFSIADAPVSNEVTTGGLDAQVFSSDKRIDEFSRDEFGLNSLTPNQINSRFYSFLDEQARTTGSTIVASTSLDPRIVVPTRSHNSMESTHATSSGRSGPTSFNLSSMPESSQDQLDFGHLPFPVSASGNSITQGNSLLSCPSASCNETFSTSRALKRHITRHERPFSCGKCERKFGSKKDVERHEATVHNQERSFVCFDTPCRRAGKPFSRRDNLLKHVREVHGQKRPAPEISGADSPGEGGRSPANTSKRRREPSPAEDQPRDDDVELSRTARKLREELRTERARFELQLRELQNEKEMEINRLKKIHEAELKDQREYFEAELRNQQSRHQVIEDRLWDLIKTNKNL